MANYTIELRKIINIYGFEEVQSWFSSYTPTDYITTAQYNVIKEAFPNWTPESLANKIINHYYLREIGFETPKMFSHFAKVKMEEIMEVKLPLLYSKCISYNPLDNINLTETTSRTKQGASSLDVNETIDDSSTKNGNGTTTSNATNGGSSLNINSDTPQGQINKQDILNGNYATTTSANESTNTAQDTTQSSTQDTENSTTSKVASNDGTTSEEESITKTKSGNSGVINQDLILKYRTLIVGVEKEIIEELNSLFMGFLF